MSGKAGYYSSWVGSGRYPVRVFSAVTGTARQQPAAGGRCRRWYESGARSGGLTEPPERPGMAGPLWEWPTPSNKKFDVVTFSARPMAPAVPRAPQASPPGIPVAGSGLAPFRHFFFGPLGGTCAQGPKQGFSTLRADLRGYGAGKVRFRGPQSTLRMAP